MSLQQNKIGLCT